MVRGWLVWGIHVKKGAIPQLVIVGIGAAMLVGAVLLWNNTRAFLAHAISAPGTVIQLRQVVDIDGGSTRYQPVVKFTARDGAVITFAASFSSDPPAYSVGEAVEVEYAPDNAQEARIRSFASLWLGASILAALGIAFTAIGLGIFAGTRRAARLKAYLLAYGNAIQTELQGVERPSRRKNNGKRPWRIVSQWLDPATNKLRVFNSENLWFDPTSYVKGREITVLLDPQDPRRYYMDVSFLPELADK